MQLSAWLRIGIHAVVQLRRALLDVSCLGELGDGGSCKPRSPDKDTIQGRYE